MSISLQLYTLRDTLFTDMAGTLATVREIGFHNHSWETSTLLDGRHALEVLADSLDPQVHLEVNAYWASVGGADTPALLRRLGGKVAALHVKNGAVPAEPPVIPEAMEEMEAVMGPITRAQKPAGEDGIDLEAVLAAAPEDTIKVIELDDYDGDVLDAVRASYAWLSEHGA